MELQLSFRVRSEVGIIMMMIAQHFEEWFLDTLMPNLQPNSLLMHPTTAAVGLCQRRWYDNYRETTIM